MRRRRRFTPWWSPLAAAALLLVLCAPARALAGARAHAFVQGTDSLPETGLEIENWFGASIPRHGGAATWEWWLGPVVGLTDHLEAGLFALFYQVPGLPPLMPGGPKTEPAFVFSSLRLQGSWLLADKAAWPVDVRIRLELAMPVDGDAPWETWLSAFVARDLWRFNFTLNAGAWLELSEEEGVTPYYYAALGASFEVITGYRIGAEVWAQAEGAFVEPQLAAGPSVALGLGRFWLAAALGFGAGEESPALRGRLVLGVVL
ncbi:MAG TPA: hypothetical protein VG389_19040 [Myxococcota bacterium]|nr:hypothetical protein [Myxococcota bacterium]